MTDDRRIASGDAKQQDDAGSEGGRHDRRLEREAQALRANLAKRKAQKRARKPPA